LSQLYNIYGNIIVTITIVKVTNFVVTRDYILVTEVSPLLGFVVSMLVLTIKL